MQRMSGLYGSAAAARLTETEMRIPTLRLFRAVPQTPPYHGEGYLLHHHILRMLTILEAIDAGESLIDIEEFARSFYWKDIVHLSNEAKDMLPLLMSFVILHDIGKADRLSFSAEKGSEAEASGLHLALFASEKDRLLVINWARLIEAEEEGMTPQRVSEELFERYGLRVHYNGHERYALSKEYTHVFDSVFSILQVAEDDRELVRMAIRHHMQVIHIFSRRSAPNRLLAFERMAVKRGLDPARFLSLLLLSATLDAVLGSEQIKDGKPVFDGTILFHLLMSEHAALPIRKAARDEEERLRRIRTQKEILESSGLVGEELYAMLSVAVGRERGEVKRAIVALIAGEKTSYDFGYHEMTIRRRVKEAQALLTKEGLL